MTVQHHVRRTLNLVVFLALVTGLVLVATAALAQQNPFDTASTQQPPACTTCPAGKDGKDGKDGRPGRDGVDGEDGRDGVDGKDGKDGSTGPAGACSVCPKPPTPTIVHFDYELAHPWTVVSPNDPPVLVAQSQHGPLPRIVHYFTATDTVVIIDFNLPADRNVLAYRRLGETGVTWTSVADYAPGVLAWFGARKPHGYAHVCLVPDDVLEALFLRMGHPMIRVGLAQFITNGAMPQIATVSAADFEAIVHSMAVQP